MIRESNRHENHHRHHCMDEIREPNFVLFILWNFDGAKPGLEHRQTFRGHEPIIDFAIGASKTVGEVKEKAGEGAEA